MTRPALFAIALSAAAALALQACDCGTTGADQRRYACTGDEQCAAGFACVGGECHRPGDGADAGHLSFATGAQTLAAGACSQQVSLEARSGGGDPWVVAADTTVDLTASPGAGFAFFSDPACTVGASTATLVQGQSTAGFYFRGTTQGAVTVSAAAPALGTASQVETVLAVSGNATALGFTTPPQTVIAGSCSGVTTVQARDGAGNPAAVSGATPISLSASPSTGFLFYADASCTARVTSVTIAAGAGAASFFFKGTLAGSVNVTAAAASLSSASQAESIVAGPPAALAFTTPAQLVTAGACSAPVTVEVEDAFGNPAAVTSATPVNLSAAPPSGFTFSASSSCAGAVTAVNVPIGASSAVFYFRSTAAGAVTISGSSSPLTSASQSETIAAGPASALAFSSAPQTVTAGLCSAAATVQARDALGNPVNVSNNTTVTLSASPSAGFQLFAASNCTSPITSVSILAGANSASFYFRGTTAGGVTVSATTASVGSALQGETIAPGPPASLEISTAPQTVLARACSGAVTLTFRDAYGNAAPVASATTVPLSSSPASGPSFYGGATCASAIGAATFPAGASSATVFFRGRTGGTFTITGAPSGVAAVSQSEVILPTVRRGTCTIAAGTTSVVCTVTPVHLDLSKTFLVFQAVPGNDGSPASANTRCRLTSTSTIACSRNTSSAADVNVAWQTVELPSGIKVQHVDAACGASNVVSIPIAAVSSIADTFVLASHEESGVIQDEDDMAMVELTSPTNVDLTLTTPCSWAISLEVVELTGVTVTEGRVQLAAGVAAITATGLPAAGTGSTVVLHSHDLAVTSSTAICDCVVRGQVDTGTSVRFRRGNGTANAACSDQTIDLAYQRVDFGALATVQQVAASMPATTLSTDVTIGAVDMTRSLVLSGGQTLSGQAMGETDYAADDIIGEATAQHALTSSTNLRLIRGSANGAAQWSAFVIQIE